MGKYKVSGEGDCVGIERYQAIQEWCTTLPHCLSSFPDSISPHERIKQCLILLNNVKSPNSFHTPLSYPSTPHNSPNSPSVFLGRIFVDAST